MNTEDTEYSLLYFLLISSTVLKNIWISKGSVLLMS